MKQFARVAAKPFAAFILTTTLLLAACGDYPNENTAAVVQVTTVIPNSGQIMASNPVVSPVNNNPSDDGIGFLNQALGYSGPKLKMPLPAGYNWRLNTEAGGNSVGGFDPYHRNHYYSLDFGRHVKDNNGKETTITDADGYGIDANGQRNGLKIDVLAAAAGTVEEDAVYTDCVNQGKACTVKIKHGETGYSTWYYHMMDGTVPEFKKGDPIVQGQFLGKMGNTGDSTGAHLHFEVRYQGRNGELVGGVWDKTPELEGVTLEGIKFADYKLDPFNPTGKFVYFPSTNGFAYDPQNGANPRTCKNGLSRVDASTFTCTLQSAFNFYRHVFGDALIRSIQQDVCLRAEVLVAGVKVYDVPEYCSGGIQPGTGLYYNNTNYFTTAAGSGQVKYYAHAKGREYLPAPFATVSFTVLNSNTPSNQPKNAVYPNPTA